VVKLAQLERLKQEIIPPTPVAQELLFRQVVVGHVWQQQGQSLQVGVVVKERSGVQQWWRGTALDVPLDSIWRPRPGARMAGWALDSVAQDRRPIMENGLGQGRHRVGRTETGRVRGRKTLLPKRMRHPLLLKLPSRLRNSGRLHNLFNNNYLPRWYKEFLHRCSLLSTNRPAGHLLALNLRRNRSMKISLLDNCKLSRLSTRGEFSSSLLFYLSLGFILPPG